MGLPSKCHIFKVLSWGFFMSVIIQSIYVGWKFGCWLGLIIAIAGVVCGFSYGRFRKTECKKL